MLRLGFTIAATLYRVAGHTPAGILTAKARTRPTLWWAPVLLAVGALHLMVAATLTAMIRDGAPGWLNLLVIWLAIDGVRLLVAGPAALVWWARSRFDRRRLAGVSVHA